LEISFIYSGNFEDISVDILETIYFAFLGFFQNTMRYSSGKEIAVQIIRNEDQILFEFQDNGMIQEVPEFGFGLENIKYEVGSHKGSLNTFIEKGLKHEIQIPIMELR